MRRGVYKLSIVQDERYIGLISECNESLMSLIHGSPIHVGFQQSEGCIYVRSYWKHWPCLFAQHGKGVKHLREIRLVPWQMEIVSRYPHSLVRGLIHSDGYRGLNRVRRPVVGEMKEYANPRYQFSNESADIREIFCSALDRLGIAWRQMNRKTISVARGSEVGKLDLIVGPKY